MKKPFTAVLTTGCKLSEITLGAQGISEPIRD